MNMRGSLLMRVLVGSVLSGCCGKKLSEYGGKKLSGCGGKKAEYVLINSIMAMIFVLTFLCFGFSFKFFFYISLFSLLCVAAVKDMKEQTIPNPLILIGLAVGLGLALFNLSMTNIIDLFLGILSPILILGTIYIISHGGIGIGDIKLFACVGIFLGLWATIEIIIISIIICGLTSLVLLKLHFLKKTSKVPFAPFVFLSAIITIFAF